MNSIKRCVKQKASHTMGSERWKQFGPSSNFTIKSPATFMIFSTGVKPSAENCMNTAWKNRLLTKTWSLNGKSRVTKTCVVCAAFRLETLTSEQIAFAGFRNQNLKPEKSSNVYIVAVAGAQADTYKPWLRSAFMFMNLQCTKGPFALLDAGFNPLGQSQHPTW